MPTTPSSPPPEPSPSPDPSPAPQPPPGSPDPGPMAHPAIILDSRDVPAAPASGAARSQPDDARTDGARDGRRNVLLVSTVEEIGAAADPHIRKGDNVKVVVPVISQGILDWLANDQHAFAHAVRVAERTADGLEGTPVDAAAGEDDLELAIHDALADFPADEIVVVIPREDEAALRSSLFPDDGGTAVPFGQGVALRVVSV